MLKPRRHTSPLDPCTRPAEHRRDGVSTSPALTEDAAPDIGPETLDDIYARLQIDEEWSVRADHGFTWWMGHYAQELTASTPTWSNGVWVSRLVARTPLATDVPRTEQTYERLGLLNAFMTTSALVLGADGCIRLITSAIVHPQIARWMGDHFALRAVMQAADAQVKAPLFVGLVGGRSAASDHPSSGTRVVLDDMSAVIARVVAPLGQEPSRWAGQEMQDALGVLRHTSLLALGDDTGVTAEFPYKNFSTLLTLRTEESHPQVGHGVHITLKLPSPPFETSVHEAAAILNEMEARGLTLFSTLHGAWCVSPSGDVAFNAFFPNAAYVPGTAVNMALWMTGKAEWVASLNDPRSEDERWEEGKPAIARIIDDLDLE